MNTVKVIQSFGNVTVAEVRRRLFKIGIRMSYDDRLAILTGNKYSRENRAIHDECNGLILDIDYWKPVCVPTPLPWVRHDASVVSRQFDNGLYTAYAAVDGSVVNIYNYMDKWRASTQNGLDMWNVERGGISYGSALAECGVVLSALDKTRQYTVVITHPKMHPAATAASVLYISSSACGTSRDWSNPPHGMKCQERCEFKSYSEIIAALEDESAQQFHGVILRSRNPSQTGYNTIIMESELMAEKRKLMYDRSFIHKARGTEVKSEDVAVYVGATRNYDRFVKTFPKLKERADEIKRGTSSIAEKIYNRDFSSDMIDVWGSIVEKTHGYVSSSGEVQSIMTDPENDIQGAQRAGGGGLASLLHHPRTPSQQTVGAGTGLPAAQTASSGAGAASSKTS